jgi:hypothetical protein
MTCNRMIQLMHPPDFVKQYPFGSGQFKKQGSLLHQREVSILSI